ncbi:MAG: hypothetical protein HC764_11225 [Pleurocapsa sp. CRU_1_2]|nr:hypothetical protein [Pleurocapsa sp. CRU_1_2]
MRSPDSSTYPDQVEWRSLEKSDASLAFSTKITEQIAEEHRDRSMKIIYEQDAIALMKTDYLTFELMVFVIEE